MVNLAEHEELIKKSRARTIPYDSLPHKPLSQEEHDAYVEALRCSSGGKGVQSHEQRKIAATVLSLIPKNKEFAQFKNLVPAHLTSAIKKIKQLELEHKKPIFVDFKWNE